MWTAFEIAFLTIPESTWVAFEIIFWFVAIFGQVLLISISETDIAISKRRRQM